MINQLYELTKGEMCGNLDLFKSVFGNEAAEKLSKEIEFFSFWDNSPTVIIYDGRQAVFDCNYDERKGKKQLTTCYDRNGLFHDFTIN